jgi:hypothetical protein
MTRTCLVAAGTIPLCVLCIPVVSIKRGAPISGRQNATTHAAVSATPEAQQKETERRTPTRPNDFNSLFAEAKRV